MSFTLLQIIIVIVLIDFFFEKFLDYLNIKNLKEQLPPELQGIYDEEKYRTSQQYEKINSKFDLITSSFSLVLILVMLLFGGFGLVDDWVISFSENIYLRSLLFFGVIGLATDLLTLPFQLYKVFVIEEKFGFNKTKPSTFIFDKMKSLGLSLVLGGGILCFVLWAWISTGTWFFVIVLGGLTAIMVFMAMFYTQLIVPLFNKQKPLEDGELKTAINDFALKTGFKLNNIFVIDGSKRSTKGNAYFSGLGPKKRIVLYDTLINELSTEEIVAVLAHEIGHYKKKHIYKGMIMSIFQSALMIWLLSLAIGRPELSEALGGTEPTFYLGLVAFGLLFSPVSFFIGIISNIISRKYEYEADAFAAKYQLGKSLVNGLIHLSTNNLSNLTPHPLYVFFNYSHPTLLQRKKAIELID